MNLDNDIDTLTDCCDTIGMVLKFQFDLLYSDTQMTYLPHIHSTIGKVEQIIGWILHYRKDLFYYVIKDSLNSVKMMFISLLYFLFYNMHLLCALHMITYYGY